MASQRKSGPRLLVTDRDTMVFLERARVRVDGGRVIYHAADDEMVRKFNLPHVNLAVLMLGQGTSITQEAMGMLAQEKVHVAFTGSGGTPLHMGSLTEYGDTAHFRRMVPVWLSDKASLEAARTLAQERTAFMRTAGLKIFMSRCGGRDKGLITRACDVFDQAATTAKDKETLMGAEGDYAKRIYAVFAQQLKIQGFVRTPGAPSGSGPAVTANSLLDHGNYLAYGISGAVLWTLGIPYNMSVLHGKTRAGGLVFDLADIFKDSLVIPTAFLAAKKGASEGEFRGDLIRAFEDYDVLNLCISAMTKMIETGEACLA